MDNYVDKCNRVWISGKGVDNVDKYEGMWIVWIKERERDGECG